MNLLSTALLGLLVLQKFRKYLLDSNIHARVQSKYRALKHSLGADYLRLAGSTMTLPRPSSMAPKSRPKRVGKAPQIGQPKVFGCALEDYIDVSDVGSTRIPATLLHQV